MGVNVRVYKNFGCIKLCNLNYTRANQGLIDLNYLNGWKEPHCTPLLESYLSSRLCIDLFPSLIIFGKYVALGRKRNVSIAGKTLYKLDVSWPRYSEHFTGEVFGVAVNHQAGVVYVAQVRLKHVHIHFIDYMPQKCIRYIYTLFFFHAERWECPQSADVYYRWRLPACLEHKHTGDAAWNFYS